jgi:hypothetical protein
MVRYIRLGLFALALAIGPVSIAQAGPGSDQLQMPSYPI